MVSTYSLGHKIVFQSNSWLYKDGRLVNDNPKSCIKCHKFPTKDGHDACLSQFTKTTIIQSACCGHGVEKGYIIFNKIKELK